MFPHEFDIVRYSPEFKDLWDNFVKTSKNGTFLFQRNYMDYHSDVFDDSSYIFFRKGKPYCLLPGCDIGVEYSSHAGLTYGGLIMGESCTTEGILKVFDLLAQTLRNKGFTNLTYKVIPYIYHKMPSEEDLYAIFRNNAKLIIRNISTTIDLSRHQEFKKDRREALRKGERQGLIVTRSCNFNKFWDLVENNLMIKYHTFPVHSREEITRLAQSFPENIKLYCSYIGDEMVAGVVCYITETTLHTQYISSSPNGRKCGAVDYIINYLIEEYSNKNYLDFGISCEDGGRFLNESLIYWKEGFGGRGVCYDIYSVPIV